MVLLLFWVVSNRISGWMNIILNRRLKILMFLHKSILKNLLLNIKKVVKKKKKIKVILKKWLWKY